MVRRMDGEAKMSKTCECGAQVSSNAPRCPKCGKNLLKSEETFKCRNCKTILLKDDHWGDKVVAGPSGPSGFVGTAIGGRGVAGSFTYAGSHRSLVQYPCPQCGELYPFMGPSEKWVRVFFQLGFLFAIGAPLFVLSLVYSLYKVCSLPFSRMFSAQVFYQPFWIGFIFSAFMFWLTIKICRKIVKR